MIIIIAVRLLNLSVPVLYKKVMALPRSKCKDLVSSVAQQKLALTASRQCCAAGAYDQTTRSTRAMSMLKCRCLEVSIAGNCKS